MSNMVVATNVMALNSHRNLKTVGSKQATASQRLSSGFRINSAADDAAGLSISEKMRSQIRGLDMASKNAQDGTSLIQTAEGGMQEIDNMLQRIRELVVQTSNDTNENNSVGTGDRQKMQDEIDQLSAEIDAMADRVEFNKKKVINGTYAEVKDSLKTAKDELTAAKTARDAIGDPVKLMGSLAIKQGSVAKKEGSVAVKAGSVAVKAASVAVKQASVDVKQKSYDVKMASVDAIQKKIDNSTNQASIDVLKLSLAQKKVSASVKKESLAVKQGSLATKQQSLAVKQGSLTVKQASLDAKIDAANVIRTKIQTIEQLTLGMKALSAKVTGLQSINATNPKALYFQVGANANQGLSVNIGCVKTNILGIGDGKGGSLIDIVKDSGRDTTGYLDTLDKALSYVTTERSKLGATQNRLDYAMKSLDISSENLSAAESRIRDTDMAKEMMKLTQANVLQQASTAMLAQANQAPQSVLQLLQ